MSIRTIDIGEAIEPLSEYAKKVADGPVVVTVGGRPVAVVLDIEGADLESISLSTNPKFIDVIERSRARLESEGGISSAEVRRRLGIPRASKDE